MSDVYNGKLLPAGWLVYTTEDGRPYFHNRLTASTQWDLPTTGEEGLPVARSSVVGAVFKDDDEDEHSLDQLGASSARMITLNDDGTNASGGALSPAITGTKKKKGYASLPKSEITTEDGIEVQPSIVLGDAAATTDDTLCCFFKLSQAQTYFNVTTASVVNKILVTYQPHKWAITQPLRGQSSSSSSSTSDVVSDSLSQYRKNFDLYGPFWISTTLIFLLFAASNAAEYIHGQHERTNYSPLIFGSTLIYGYLSLVPVIVWTLVQFLGEQRDKEVFLFREFIAVYGYSYCLCIITTLLCIIPSMILRWLCAVLGSTLSSLFLFMNFRNDLSEALQPLKLALMGIFVLAQISLYATFPLYYFSRA